MSTYVVVDGIDSNGCECHSTGAELPCDTIDNNCNGLVDENTTIEVCDGIDNDCVGGIDNGLTPPSWVCNMACPGAAPHCSDTGSGFEWWCSYGAQVQLDGDGDPVANETLCDGLDNDCDSQVDEGPGIADADLLGTACSESYLACTNEGWWACSTTPTAAPVCCTGDVVVCDVGEVTAPSPVAEGTVPDGEDDDCDGFTDEGVTGCVQSLQVDTGPSEYQIFAYEAARWDATTIDEGEGSSVPCSQPNKLPWTMASEEEAEAACALLNANPSCNPATSTTCWGVCSWQQWQYACQYGTPSASWPHTYPYGNAYGATTCNGFDKGEADLLPSGDASIAGCIADYTPPQPYDVHEMSGNAEEWTRSETVTGSGLYQIRGGSYNDVAGGLTCSSDFYAAEDTAFRMDNLGFRCCMGEDPAGETCVGGCTTAPSANHCASSTVAHRWVVPGTCYHGGCVYEENSYSCLDGCTGAGICTEPDGDGDGYTTSGGDCNDFDPLVGPMAFDKGVDPWDPVDPSAGVDLVDNDCDGATDEDYATCACTSVGTTAANMLCALDVGCDTRFVGTPTVTSTTGVSGTELDDATVGVSWFGDGTNELDPRGISNSYALVATGIATGTFHSQGMVDTSNPTDTFGSGVMYNGVDFTITITTPVNAQGFSFDYVFFSEEYDEWVGSSFNDKFYAILNGGGWTNRIINFTACRSPATYTDFTCPGGSTWCVPGNPYCYIAINTSLSEPCWYGGTPSNVCATNTDIQGTGYSCYMPTNPTQCGDSDTSATGSSTGWLRTQWPVLPSTTYTIRFHVHDTADPVWDSEVLLENWRWRTTPTTGGTFPA
jgi:hypothetical protein